MSQVEVQIKLVLFGEELRLRISVPEDRVPSAAILPLARGIVQAVEERTAIQLAKSGLQISCSRGCAHCCRKLIPVSAIEARHLRGIVGRAPGARRQIILDNFARARTRLDELQLLDQLRSLPEMSVDQFAAIGRAYFSQTLDCPFLYDESCLIHDERPLACREHLVASPPAYCSPAHAEDTVSQVMLPCSPAWAVARMEAPANGRFPWISLPFILDWPGPASRLPQMLAGPDLIRIFVTSLVGTTSGPFDVALVSSVCKK